MDMTTAHASSGDSCGPHLHFETPTTTPDYAPDVTKGRAAYDANRGTDEVHGVHAARVYLRNWHDDVHDGAIQHCLREPCYGLTRVLGH